MYTLHTHECVTLKECDLRSFLAVLTRRTSVGTSPPRSQRLNSHSATCTSYKCKQKRPRGVSCTGMAGRPATAVLRRFSMLPGAIKVFATAVKKRIASTFLSWPRGGLKRTWSGTTKVSPCVGPVGVYWCVLRTVSQASPTKHVFIRKQEFRVVGANATSKRASQKFEEVPWSAAKLVFTFSCCHPLVNETTFQFGVLCSELRRNTVPPPTEIEKCGVEPRVACWETRSLSKRPKVAQPPLLRDLVLAGSV